VATIVLKLFEAAQPDVAFFGQKDYQQQLVIRRMCEELLVPVEIRTCPTVREPDGLAMSSRNAYLSPEQRRSALALSQALRAVDELFHAGDRDPGVLADRVRRQLTSTPGLEIDYAVIVDPQTLAELAEPQPEMVALVAARVGSTRLIDNTILRC
jgi:pantoate--beta-alanine ligase